MSEVEEKILKLIKKHQFASFATTDEQGKPWVRYVVTRGSDDFSIRLGTRKDSKKVTHIAKNPEVHVLLGIINPMNATGFVQVQGLAEFSDKEEDRRNFWYGHLERYFSGPDDPNYGVVTVRPYRIEYHGIEET